MIIKTSYSKDSDAAVLLNGKFTIDAEADFEKKLNHIFSKNPGRIIINMKDVNFIDSSGIGVLMKCKNRAENSGINFILYDISGNIENSLSNSGLNQFFTISNNKKFDVLFQKLNKFK